MKKETIVVTGGLGFIGSNLIEFLIEKKFNIINVDKVSYSSNFYNVKDFKSKKNYTFYKLDIGNKKKISQILFKEKPSLIFNLAAETHVDRSIDTPYNFIKNNVLSTFNFLEVFKNYYKKNKKIKMLHVSTDEVYGDILKGRSSENQPYNPSSPYASSKAASDQIINSYIKTYNLPIIVTNCSNNYGPKQHPEKLIPKIIYNILNNHPCPIFGNGKNSREWIYVKDHCSALFKIIKYGKLGSFYNIGSGKNLTNNQICKIILKTSSNYMRLGNKTKIIYVKDRPGHDSRYAINSNKLKNELNWKPKINLEKGIKLTLEWYLNNKQYFKNFSKKDIMSRMGKL